MKAITAAQLSKEYANHTAALIQLDLEIGQGEIFGFLGPNGAGKTTTVKLLNGLLTPTGGSCEIMGMPPQEKAEEVHRLCGVMTESAKMYAQLTGIQNLLFFAQTSGMSKKEGLERAELLLKRLGILEAKDKKAGSYSTGMMQRLSLARALIHRPQILFLDEPTSGLDPESAYAVNSLISDMASQEGVTVFLCTHQLRYAQDLCTEYGLISKGRLLASGCFEKLAEEMCFHPKAAVRTGDRETPDGFERRGEWIYKTISGEGEMPGLLGELISAGRQIYEARVEHPSLEDIYFAYIGRELDGVRKDGNRRGEIG